MDSRIDVSGLSETAKMILDFLLNVPATYHCKEVLETIELLAPDRTDILQSEWDALIEANIVVKSDYYFVVNTSLVTDVKLALDPYLKERDITQESVVKYLEGQVSHDQRRLSIFANLVSKAYKSGNVEQIVFSDYDWLSELMPPCDELTRRGIAFRKSTSSRKHYYRSYYLRSWPFDSGQILRNTILGHLNVEGLRDDEWKVVFLLLLCDDLRLKYEVLRRNMGLTDPELRELVIALRDRGLLSEDAEYVSLAKPLSNQLSEYFKTNVYPPFKDRVVEHLKRTVAKSLSNLWLFTGAKRISELAVGEIKSAPIPSKLVDKSRVPEFEQQFEDMTSLGLVFDLDDKILIIVDIVKDVETWLRSSLNASIIFIPRKDFYLASRVLRDIFSKCDTYAKIQDPYIGEETFDILQYIPEGVSIQLLAGLKLGAGEDPDKVCQRIERFGADRKGKFEIIFIAKPTGATPFHDRFIISKNNCWTTGTSLKQIGEDKDTAITAFSKDKGGEEIELMFDSLWLAKPEDLKERGYVKLDFEGWKKKIIP